MPLPRVRDFHDDDLDQVVRVWEESRSPERDAVHGLAEVLAAIRDEGVAVVAVVGEVVVGAAAARVSGDRGWVVLLALGKDWRHRGLGATMLTELEKRLMGLGVHRLSALLSEDETGVQAFHNSGYEQRDLTYFERVIPLQPQEVGLLGELGGRILPGGLWDALAGMEHEKEVIERRIVLPLVDPDLAGEYGVKPPRAVVLFGPPGTGKTTFAKAVSSRLGWPFVEVFPSRLAAAGDGQALALRDTFAEIDALEHAVVFIDEVEEIAGRRGGKPPPPQQGVTNELLKMIPTFRERDGRLLVCATNFVRELDPAFLRHGRFDYVIPVGAPDAAARAAIWRRYLPEGALERIDVDALVEASDLFTPADIEFAARKGSQRALETAVYGEQGDQPEVRGPATDDYLAALGETRPTLTKAMVDDFNEDIEAIARL
jgi:transitional endoplasmic reticulum ATPase